MTTTLYEKLDRVTEHLMEAIDWKRNNPQAYRLFCRLALKYSNRGERKIGSKMIFEVMRWFLERKTNFTEEYKLNNNLTRYVAKLACEDHPVLKKAFEFRENIRQ